MSFVETPIIVSCKLNVLFFVLVAVTLALRLGPCLTLRATECRLALRGTGHRVTLRVIADHLTLRVVPARIMHAVIVMPTIRTAPNGAVLSAVGVARNCAIDV